MKKEAFMEIHHYVSSSGTSWRVKDVSDSCLIQKLVGHVRGGHFQPVELVEVVAIIEEQSEIKVEVNNYERQN